MRPLSTLAALALLAGSVLADAPVAKIAGPISVKAGESFYLDAAGSISEKPITWKLNGKPTPFRVFDEGPRKGVLSIAVGLEAGSTMRFSAVAKGTVDGELDADVAVWDVRVEGSSPKPPDPTPDPDPTPTPAPALNEKLWIIYIADANAKVSDLAKQTRFKRSPAIEAAANENDAVFRWYQSDEPDLIGYKWLEKVPSLPAVLYVSKSGKVVGTPLVSPDEAAIVAGLRKLRGK